MILPAVRPGWLALAGLTVSVVGLLAQASSADLGVVAGGSALVAAGTTFALPPVAMLIVLLTAPNARASALAVYGCCLAVGASLGAELPSRLPSWFGYPSLCALIASSLGLVALALATTVPTDPSQTLAPRLAPTSGSVGALPKEG
jgi:hypothetical protein